MSWVLLVTPLYVVLPSLYYTPCYIPQPVINPPAFKVFFLKRNCSNRRHRVVIFRTSGRDLTTWRPGLSSSFLYSSPSYIRILFFPFTLSIDYNSCLLSPTFITDCLRTNCSRVQFTLSVPFYEAVRFATTERKKERDRENGDETFRVFTFKSFSGRQKERVKPRGRQ